LDFASIFFDNSEDIEKEAKRLLTNNDSIHYHVFIEKDIVDIIDWCNKNTKAKFDIVKIKHTTKNPADNEFIIILKVIK
jgi:3-dehydroquinate dehydratase